MRRFVAVTLAVLVLPSCGDPAGPRVTATLDVVGGQGQSGEVGIELANPLVARALDADGAPVPGQLINFVVASGGGSVFAGAAITNSSGIAQERWTLGTSSGQVQQVEARAVDATTGAPLVFAVFTATAHAGPPAQFQLVHGNTQTAAVNTALPESLVVRLVDRFGNALDGNTVAWSVSAGGGTVSPSSVVSSSGGLAATRVTLGATPANLQVTASVGSVSISLSASAVAGPPVTITKVAGDGQTATVGTAVAVGPTVKVTDAGGNPVIGQSVHFTVFSGTAPAAAVTDSAGRAIGSWTLGTSIGSQSFQVSVPVSGVTPVTFTAAATAGSPAQVQIVHGNTQVAAVNTALPESLIVKLLDQFGNVVDGSIVGWSVSAGGGTASPTSVLSSNGGLAATRVTLGTTPVNLRVTASAGSISTIFAASAIAGPPVAITKLAGDSQTATVGTAVGVVPKVKVTDAGGNPVIGQTVTFSFASGNGTPGQASALTDTAGQALVGSWTLGTKMGSQSFQASVPGVTPATFTATATAGSPVTMRVEQGDSGWATAGAAVAVPPAVRVRDQYANPVRLVAVTFAAAGGGSVTGGSAVTNDSGIATVGSWTLGTSSVLNTLTASATGLPSVNFVGNVGVMLTATSGRVFDVLGDRALYLVPGATPSLNIRTISSGTDQVVMATAGKQPQFGFLTSLGAIFIEYPGAFGGAGSASSALYDYRSGALTAVPGVSTGLAVSGDYAVFHRATVGLVRRDLLTASDVTVASATASPPSSRPLTVGNGVAEDGDVAYLLMNGDMHLFRGGVDTLLANAPVAFWSQPLTDGTSVIVAEYGTTSQRFMWFFDGTTGTFLQPGINNGIAVNAGTHYRINTGWTARTGLVGGILQVFTRSPAGTTQQVTSFTSSSTISALGPNGELVVTTGTSGLDKYFYASPSATPVALGTFGGTVKWDGHFVVFFDDGRVFQLTP